MHLVYKHAKYLVFGAENQAFTNIFGPSSKKRKKHGYVYRESTQSGWPRRSGKEFFVKLGELFDKNKNII